MKAFCLFALLVAGCDTDAGTYNVRNFGAVANDGVDDTAAFQQAVNVAHFFGGGVVFIPKGVWDIFGTIELEDRIGLRLQGVSVDATVLRGNGNQPVLRARRGPFGVGADHLLIEDLTIDGGPFPGPACLVDLQRVLDSRIQKIRVKGAHDAICIRAYSKVELSQFDLLSATRFGTGLTVGCTAEQIEPGGICGADLTIRDGHVNLFGVGMRVLNADAVFTANLSLGQNTFHAMTLEPTVRSTNHTFSHSVFDATRDGPGVWILGPGVVEVVTFADNWVASSGQVPGGTPNVGVQIDGPGPRGQISWTGGRIFNHSVGMRVNTPTSLLVSGVQFSHSSSGVDLETAPGVSEPWIASNRGGGQLRCGVAGIAQANRFLGGQLGC